MSWLYTADELITQVKLRGMIPTSSNTLATADYLSFINDEIQTFIAPLIMSVREEFFVTYADQTIVSGTAAYSIPSRAIGAKLRNVLLLDGSTYRPLPRLEVETLAVGSTSPGSIEGYYLEGNNVVLYPTPGSAGTLRLSYFIRPNRVVASTAYTTVNSKTATTVSIGTPSTAFPTAATYYDFIKPTAHFECHAIDQSATRSLGTLTIAAGVPTAVAAGDYVCLAGEAPFPQIPVELHPLLAERVVVRALQALGDPKVEIAMASADRMRTAALTLLTPRSEGSSRYVINYNAPGFGRRPRYWRG